MDIADVDGFVELLVKRIDKLHKQISKTELELDRVRGQAKEIEQVLFAFDDKIQEAITSGPDWTADQVDRTCGICGGTMTIRRLESWMKTVSDEPFGLVCTNNCFDKGVDATAYLAALRQMYRVRRILIENITDESLLMKLDKEISKNFDEEHPPQKEE